MGNFFITTDWTGTKGFMTARQIRELHKRGHLIGSHSCSHPEPMASLDFPALLREWKDSVNFLSDIVGEQVATASVPGGYYSRQVADAAEAAGVKELFTSEPTTATTNVKSCVVMGRYAIDGRMSPQISAAIASGKILPRFQQAALWSAKSIAKQLGGRQYIRFRHSLLSWMEGQSERPF